MVSPEELLEFEEWRALFTLYRNDGKLNSVNRKRFKDLSLKLSLWIKRIGEK